MTIDWGLIDTVLLGAYRKLSFPLGVCFIKAIKNPPEWRACLLRAETEDDVSRLKRRG